MSLQITVAHPLFVCDILSSKGDFLVLQNQTRLTIKARFIRYYINKKDGNVKRLYHFIILLLAVCGSLMTSCNDDDSFSTSTANRLSFSVDTLRLDTAFTNMPTPQSNFWIYNRSGDGIRIAKAMLEHGNQSGYQVNIDGIFLGKEMGYQTSEVEVRKGDSVRVYVKLLAARNGKSNAQPISDNLILRLESGVEQRLNISGFAWDANIMKDVRISRDSTLDASSTPIVITGGITIDSLATLTIAPGSNIYFQSGAGMNVYGRLKSDGTAEKNITLRGARLDKMFPYLPYDRVSGQWEGLHFMESSYDNIIKYTDIHSTYNGIIIDSSNVDRKKLTLEASMVHNCQGYGVLSQNSNIDILNSQISNTLYDCLNVMGGKADINGCTLAQFYPFDSNRGYALAFSAEKNKVSINCHNSIITGYADDMLLGSMGKDSADFVYNFEDCVIRTPRITTADSVKFARVIFEDVKDTASCGKHNFKTIDEDNLYYDFHLSPKSIAIGKGNVKTLPATDRDGLRRENLSIGAFDKKEKQ